MKITQIVGPFKNSVKDDGTQTPIFSSNAPSNSHFTYLGVQLPGQWPVYDNGLDFGLQKATNGFRMNPDGVLELEGLSESKIELYALKDLPAETVINIISESEED